MARSAAGMRTMIDNLYLNNDYLDMGAVIAAPYPFIILVSARGGGKTYGVLKECALKDIRYMYFRRTQRILEIVTDPALHPYKKINEDNKMDIQPEYSKGIGRFYDRQHDNKLLGYAAALSTFANVRGFDGSDIDLIIYDEFIPQDDERITFNTFTALLNAIETIGRNREIEGKPPVKVLLLSNSDVIYGDIVAGFNIGDDLMDMQESGQEQREKSSDMLLIMPAGESFKEKKKETALYRVTKGTRFSEVALENKFNIHDRKMIRTRPLKEYRPVATLYGICIYRHKAGGGYYISEKIEGAPERYEANETERRRFLRAHPEIWRAYQKKRISFENLRVQTIYKKLFE